MIKHIIFDLGGVLVNLNFNTFYSTLAKTFNINIEELEGVPESRIHKNYMKGKITSEQYYEFIRNTYKSSINIDEFINIWNIIIDGQNNEVAEIVKSLSRKYELALLSNTDPWHFSYCYQNYSVMKFFKKRFLSYERQFLKPEKEFFYHVADELKTQPEHCIFIDDLTENIRAAGQVGYNTIQFNNATQLKKDLEKSGIRLTF